MLTCLSLHQQHTVLITILTFAHLSPPILAFFKIVVAIRGPLYFHLYFRRCLLIFTPQKITKKNRFWLELFESEDKMENIYIFTILWFLMLEHNKFPHLFPSCLFFLNNVLLCVCVCVQKYICHQIYFQVFEFLCYFKYCLKFYFLISCYLDIEMQMVFVYCSSIKKLLYTLLILIVYLQILLDFHCAYNRIDCE